MPSACARLLLFLLGAGILFLGGIGFPFSLNEAQASFSFYGHYDYSEKDVADNKEGIPTSPTSEDRQQRKGEEKASKQVEKVNEPAEKNIDDRTESTWSEQDFDRSDLDDPKYREYLTKFKYVLYYGGFDSRVADAILAVKPTLLITNYQAIDAQMRDEFARSNISVIAYLPIHWTDRPLEATLAEARDLLMDGADGLFIDEAAAIATDWEYWYHGKIYETAKEFDKDSIVVINPGSASISERSMQIADIICFEHEWRDIASLNWASDYPGWRFMGISSNEFVKVMGYHVGSKSAHDDLDEARSLNIAYHYSADHYIWLPSWLDAYGGIANSLHPVGAYLDLDLNPIARPPDPWVSDQDSDEDHVKPDDSSEKPPDEAKDEPERDPPQDEEPPKDNGDGKDNNDSDDDSPKENQVPRAHAGEDQSLSLSPDERLTVNLDGTASREIDSQNGTLSFAWVQTGGPEVTLKGAKTGAASFVLEGSTFTDSSDLAFEFELTVTDADGEHDSDSVTILAKIEETMPEKGDSGDSGSSNSSNTEINPKNDSPNENAEKDSTQRQSNSTGTDEDNSDLVKTEPPVDSNGTATS